jgi:hypothetical protein
VKYNGIEFVPTDWLKLETAVEIIGDMIAYYHGMLCEERTKAKQDKAFVEELSTKVHQLCCERRQCYEEGKQIEVIAKAYEVYGPFLKKVRNIQ